MTGSDAQALFVIDDAQRAQYVVVVQQRFALPHANDIGNAATHKALHCDNLVDDFPCGQIARKAFFSRCAKRARHWATSLRGEADRKAVSVTRRDSNGFDAYAIVVLQKQLMGAVAGDGLFEHIGYEERILLGKLSSELCGKVGYVVVVSSTFTVKPFVKLLCAKRGLTELLHKGSQVA